MPKSSVPTIVANPSHRFFDHSALERVRVLEVLEVTRFIQLVDGNDVAQKDIKIIRECQGGEAEEGDRRWQARLSTRLVGLWRSIWSPQCPRDTLEPHQSSALILLVALLLG